MEVCFWEFSILKVAFLQGTFASRILFTCQSQFYAPFLLGGLFFICAIWAFSKLLQQFSISHFREKWVGLGWLFPSFSFLPWPHLNAERVSLCWWAVGWQFCWLVWNMIGVATHDAVKYWWVTEGSRWSSYLLSVMSTDTRQLPSSMPHLPWQRLTP